MIPIVMVRLWLRLQWFGQVLRASRVRALVIAGGYLDGWAEAHAARWVERMPLPAAPAKTGKPP